jgi:hypothetical protein
MVPEVMLCYYTDPVGVQGPRRVNPREINAKITTTHHTTCREQAVSTPCKRLRRTARTKRAVLCAA